MRWPKHPAESVRPSRFLPPFCPWPTCSAHLVPSAGFQRWGSYRKPNDIARIPRFRCRQCLRTCSRQTFSTSYYLKRRELLVCVAAGLVAGSAHRQIARSAHCSKTTITRMAERLGRHALLFHARCVDEVVLLDEPIVHDHFETFVGRQDHALGIGTAVGANSWFLYDVDPAPHRGSGRRPDRGKGAMVKAQRPYVESIRRTIRALLPKVSAPNRLHCVVDGRIDYQAAIRAGTIKDRVRLRVYPNPKRGPKGSPRTAEAKARDWAMFPADQLHQLVRHTCSDHKRETISFGRRIESILGRAHLVAVWKNFIKSRSERKPDRTTPAMRLGLTDARWRWEWVLSRRLFPARVRPAQAALELDWPRITPDFPELERKHAA
jgi:transposase-like protein